MGYYLFLIFRVVFGPFCLFLLFSSQLCQGQSRGGNWSELVGKKVVDNRGVAIGRISDAAIDLENGRCLAFLVSSGGFMGIGERVQFVPPGAFTQSSVPRVLVLNMNKQTFKKAPTFEISNSLGPPEPSQVAIVFRYFGQEPSFSEKIVSSQVIGKQRSQLGYTRRMTRIYNMPVENLQGVRVGYVWGLRDLNNVSGRIGGVVISPEPITGTAGFFKIVQPQVLRYTSDHNRLRINNSEQEFMNSPDFSIMANANLREDSPVRPGGQPVSVAQGNSMEDKRITSSIVRQIGNDESLSHYAKNISVGTVNKTTVVRGRVESIHDRDRILAHATKVAGFGSVFDLLHIRAKTMKEKTIDARLQ